MKLWLLEILACPIDKAFPLELTILKWENEQKGSDEIQELIKRFRAGNVLPPKMETPVKSQINEQGNLMLNDFLILKPTPINDYLNQLVEKIEELKVVHDKSTWVGEEALNLIRNEIKESFQIALKNMNSDNQQEIFESLVTALEFLNLFKYNLEIEDGLIKCPECHRWFPIFETIPQMLPDEVRNQESDNAFKQKWEEKISFI